MTYASIEQCTRDTELQARVKAAASKEAWASPEYSLTVYGERLRTYPDEALATFMWPIAIDNEDDYAYALDTDKENPGSADVITDAALQAGVQAHWPADPATVPLPTTMVGTTPGAP